jgi:hypothetical protein
MSVLRVGRKSNRVARLVRESGPEIVLYVRESQTRARYLDVEFEIGRNPTDLEGTFLRRERLVCP